MTPKFCRAWLEDHGSKSHDQAYRIVRTAVAASGQKSLLDEAIDQLKSGVPAKACRAWLVCDKSFTYKQSQRIVRKALAEAEFTDLAAARKMHLQSVIDQLKSGMPAKACRAWLVRDKGFTFEQAKRIVRKALAGADCTDLAAVRKMHLQSVIDQLKSGMPATACRAWLVRDKGFTYRQAKRIVWKALARAECTDLAAARQVAVAEVIADLRADVTPRACRAMLRGKGWTIKQSKIIVRHAVMRTSGRIRTHELCGVVVQLRAGVPYTTCLELLAGKLKSLQLARHLMRRAMHFVTKTCTLDNDHTFRKAHGILQEGYGVHLTVAPRVSQEQKMPRRWARLYAEKAYKLLRGG